MRIESLHPEGFGHFAGQEIGPFTSPLTVIHGHNEAGKSTLLAFIRTILFGFPAQNRAKHYPPLAGGRHGGRITLLDDDDRRYVVERIEAPGSQTLRITLPDGSQSNDEAVLRGLLGNAQRQVFESVFAFGLLDLQKLDAFDKSDLAQQIYAAGIGAANLPAVQDSLTRDAEKIFKQRGHNQAAVALIDDLRTVEAEIDRLQGESAEYAAKSEELRSLQCELAASDRASAGLAAQLAEFELLARAWDDWIARDDLIRHLDQLPEYRGFPSDAVGRLDQSLRDVADADEACKRLSASLDSLRERAAAPIPGEPLLDAAALAEDVRRQRGSLEHSITDLPKRQAELESLESRVTTATRQLGPGWDEPSVVAFDVSVPVRDAIEQWSERLRAGVQAEHDARGRDELALATLTEAAARFERANAEFEAVPAPTLSATAIAARRDLVRSARSRLAELVAASGQRVALQAQQVILEARQPAPARSNGYLAPAMLAGAAAVATAGLGIFAGGAALVAGLAFALVLLGAAVWLIRTGSANAAPVAVGLREVPGLREATAAEERAAAELGRLAASLQCEPVADAFDGAERDLAEQATKLERYESAVAALEEAAEDRDRAASRRDETARLAASAADALEAARAAWRDWLASHGLEPNLSPTTALVLVGQLDALQQQIAGLATLRDRVAKIEADIRRETARVAEFAAVVGFRFDGANPHSTLRAADELLRRFDAAREAAARRASLEDQAAEREHDHEAASRRLAAAQSALAGLLDSCGATDPADLRARAAIHEERRTLADALASRELALRTHSGPGEAYDRLLRRLSESDIAAIELQRDTLRARKAELAERAAAARSELGAVQLRLEQLATDDRSSSLRAQRAVIIEQLRGHAENWSRLTIARALLDRARSRFERERQPAVIKEAGQYFAAMTRSRYSGVFVPIGSSSVEALPADGGEPRLPQQLSQGTQEQLYLAMRFGLVEHFARQASTLPVVVDEVLVNFDPDRAHAAACGFSRLARKHQVVVFTCHPWVVDTFRDADPMTRVVELDGVAAIAPRLFAATAGR